jgi:hypothetical protein
MLLVAAKEKSHNLHLHNNDADDGATHHLLSILSSPSYHQNATTPAADGTSFLESV